MHRLVERSVTLWKAKNGPFRKSIAKLATKAAEVKPYDAVSVHSNHAFFIDYCQRDCDYV